MESSIKFLCLDAFITSSNRNNDASGLEEQGEEEEEEEEEEAVVGSIDGPFEALCVTYGFLVKFTDEKELVTDGWTA